MLIRLNLRAGLILLAALAILVAGVAYATTVISQRQVSGSLILGQVQALGPILLFSQITPSSADLTGLAFAGDIDSSGSFVTPPREPFWAANSGSVPFNLILVATDVVVKRGGNTILSGDGILALLMGPAGGTLLSSADHATLIDPGDPPVALWAGIEFLQAPQDLGLIQGDVITFTALFKALEVHTTEAVPGDVNGDGKADFIVGAYLDDPAGGGTDAGSAYVYSGADGSLLYQVSGDTAGDWFGYSVSMAGDVNGDGRTDFIVGAYFDDPAGGGTSAGSAYVFSGADGSLLYQRTGDTANDFFGASVSGAGDVNGDGRADFIVGARLDDPVGGGTNAGSAYVFSGADGSLLYQRTGDTANDYFGYSVSGAGHVNGDGKADFIVGAWGAGGGTDAGSAYVYSGADGSLLYQKTGDTAGDQLGISVSGAGDVNGDGVPDLIVGAFWDDPGGLSNAGSAYVFSGADGSLLYQVTGDTVGDNFGISVSGAGDVNGDGRADFIVGAYFDDPAGGGTDAGSAYVFSGADGSLLYQRTGDTAGDRFGFAVGGGGP